MAVFYTGYRPILRGQNDSDWVNTYTGRRGTYSNWSLMSSAHVLDGAPNTNHTPGTGYSPHGLQLTRRFLGYDAETARVKNAGSGARLTGMRYRPKEYKGLDGAEVFQSNFGHVVRVTAYSQHSNWIYYGLAIDDPLLNPGHPVRNYGDPGVPATFGVFRPSEPHGVAAAQVFVSTYGQAVPATASTNPYGHNRVREWRGVTSAKALNV